MRGNGFLRRANLAISGTRSNTLRFFQRAFCFSSLARASWDLPWFRWAERTCGDRSCRANSA
jgi:hypothetical protein